MESREELKQRLEMGIKSLLYDSEDLQQIALRVLAMNGPYIDMKLYKENVNLYEKLARERKEMEEAFKQWHKGAPSNVKEKALELYKYAVYGRKLAETIIGKAPKAELAELLVAIWEHLKRVYARHERYFKFVLETPDRPEDFLPPEIVDSADTIIYVDE